MTGYTDWFPAAALETMIEMEADRMQGASFDPQVLESERGVIASERRMGVENSNDAILSENVRATAIMAHPYHWDVIGWMSDILSWKRDEIMAYYKTYYAPNNAVLILVGDFEPVQALELIRKYYGAIPAGPPPPAVSTVEPPQMGPKDVVIRKEAQAPSFQMVFHAPSGASPDFPPLAILDLVLLNGESSRLYKRLVRDEQLALSRFRGDAGEHRSPPLHHRAQAAPRRRPRQARSRHPRGDREGQDRRHHRAGIPESPEHDQERVLLRDAVDQRQGRGPRPGRDPPRLLRVSLRRDGPLRHR